MPLTPSGARTFLRALSDFWSAFFKDRAFLDAYADALALDAAQLYQSLLEAALGVSLRDLPLYDRVFFKGCPLREDRLTYREGETPDEDRFLVEVGDGLASAEYLTNRVLVPTAFLTEGRDYSVERGVVAFRTNPFDADGQGGPLPFFPTRVVQVTSPSVWEDPLGRAWTGVLPGDIVRLRVGGGEAEAPVTGVVGAVLHLGEAPALLQQTVARRGAEVTVLRRPYDPDVVGRPLPAHPTDVRRVTTGADDAATVASTRELNFSAEPAYTGPWAPSTAYAEGALVDQGGTLRRAKAAHTSGLGFDASRWDDLGVGYVYVAVPSDPRYDGLYGVTTPTGAGRVALVSPAPFTAAARARVHRVTYTPSVSGSPPRLTLPHTYVQPGTVEIAARRAVARTTVDADGVATVHPAGGAVLPGVDYLLDADDGAVTALSAWDPARPARASYSWRLARLRRTHAWRGAYVSPRAYVEGDLVLDGTVVRVVRRSHTSDGSVDATRYATFREPAAFAVPHAVREIGAWATDALVDEERLYRNFGSLLDRPRATSEAYRVFLRAVSRLFLLGPTFDRFESALNAVAELPLIRDDGEVLANYDDGVTASGGDGSLYGMALGHDGVLIHSTSRFTSASVPFLATDVGANLRVTREGRVESYVVSAYVNASTVEVSPVPQDGAALQWDFRHPVLSDRLRVGGSYRFTEADVGASILLASGAHAHNRGVFRITSLDDPLTVVLDTAYGFVDEVSVTWKLSRTGVQRVTTTRAVYDIPIGVPMRTDVMDAASRGVLTFGAFEALTRAFRVVDYLEDPTWWHRVTIPEELMPGSGSRRTVTPELVEHVYGSLDGAQVGDEGLFYGGDDEGRSSARRAGDVIWYGGDRVVLSFAPGVQGARARDVGQHLVVSTPSFRGHFRVRGVESDGVTLRLERFPPPEADGMVPPQTLSAELPPIVYRRTVAFILMDRHLKYHSVQVRVDPSVGLSTELLEATLRVVKTAKPSHVFVFFETLTSFRDVLDVEESVELDLNHHLEDLLRFPNAQATYAPTSLLRYGDCYRFVARSTSFTPTPGLVQALPTVLPAGPTAVRTLVKVAFDPAARVGGRRPIEGTDYTVDYTAGTVKVTGGVTITPNPVDLFYVDCIRRVLAPSDPHDPGETAIVYGGTDPTFVRGADQNPEVTGLVDRAVQLTLGP